MTGESAEKTEPWIEEHGARYAYGMLESSVMSDFMAGLKMSGYPSAALVSPDGKVVWAGHPSEVSSSLIGKHIKGADKRPVNVRAITKNWPSEAKPVEAAVKKGQLAKALALASKMQLTDVVSDVERTITERASEIRAMHDAGDYLGFCTAMKKADVIFGATEAASELGKLEGALKSNKMFKGVLSGQKKLAKLQKGISEIRKIKDVEKMEKAVNKLIAKLPDTIVSRDGEKVLTRLTKLRGRLNRR